MPPLQRGRFRPLIEDSIAETSALCLLQRLDPRYGSRQKAPIGDTGPGNYIKQLNAAAAHYRGLDDRFAEQLARFPTAGPGALDLASREFFGFGAMLRGNAYDDRRESFNRDKILRGVAKACDKRNIPMDRLEELVDTVEVKVYDKFEREVPAHAIGEFVSEALRNLDQVAYVRFASVYRRFEDISSFEKVLATLLGKDKRRATGK